MNCYDLVMSSPRALSDRATFLVSQLGNRGAQRFAEGLAPLGIHPSHFGLLTLLSAEEGRSQQQLGDALGIHRNVMVGLVDYLESRGLVERRRHPADRRAYAIHLTPQARELLPRAAAVADALDDELFAGLSADERTALVALLRRAAENLGTRPDVHPGLRGEAH